MITALNPHTTQHAAPHWAVPDKSLKDNWFRKRAKESFRSRLLILTPIATLSSYRKSEIESSRSSSVYQVRSFVMSEALPSAFGYYDLRPSLKLRPTYLGIPAFVALAKEAADFLNAIRETLLLLPAVEKKNSFHCNIQDLPR